MAQKTVVQLIDDLDGTSGDTIETVTFALEGVTYEIDLAENNATRLCTSIAAFVNAATRTGGRLKRGVGATQPLSADGRVRREQQGPGQGDPGNGPATTATTYPTEAASLRP